MALVTTTDLREYMSDVSLSAAQMRTAQTVLDGVQQKLELYLRRPVQPMQVRERRASNAAGDIILSVTPVYKVLSLRAYDQDEATAITEHDTTPLTAQEVDRMWDTMALNTMIVPGGINVARNGVWYTVEYIGGYNGWADDALKLAILEVASRIMTVHHDDTLSLKDGIANEPQGGQPLDKNWTKDELAQFDRLRRRMVLR